MSLDWTALSDGELATLSIAGRQAAFAEIVRRYRQPMFRLSRAFLGDADEALDVTQEAFVAAHQALSRYDPNRSMQAWLTTIAVNKCRDWARKRFCRSRCRTTNRSRASSTNRCRSTTQPAIGRNSIV